MKLVLGFVAGVAAALGVASLVVKRWEKNGQIMDLEELIDEMATKGALVHIPDRFPIVLAEYEDKAYIEVDNIRLIVEDGELIGWYNPGELEA